jgi:putative serine protease PepD
VARPGGQRAPATLLGAFPDDDLAVVKVTGVKLQPAHFGDSSKLVVGDITMALGNPLGLQSSVTEGIISALGRTVVEPGGVPIPNAIQTSAQINPGQWGALVDLQGEVIGIPTLAATDPEIGGSAPGIGFAIPSNTVKDIASQIIRYGHVVNSHRAYLGVTFANLLTGQGVLVCSVESGGPAAKDGIVPGDVITQINGFPSARPTRGPRPLRGSLPGSRSRSVSSAPTGAKPR